LNLNKFKCVDDKFNLSIGSEVELRNDFAFVNGNKKTICLKNYLASTSQQ